jgi:hypothetical protein
MSISGAGTTGHLLFPFSVVLIAWVSSTAAARRGFRWAFRWAFSSSGAEPDTARRSRDRSVLVDAMLERPNRYTCRYVYGTSRESEN